MVVSAGVGVEAGRAAPRVSVVVPAFNEEMRIGRCLSSLLRQRTAQPFEIVVVDSSTDATPRLIRERFPSVRVIHRERQTFPAEARNIGVGACRGEIVAFIDADCCADPDWIDSIVAAHDDACLAVGGSVKLDAPATVAGAALFAIEFSEYGPGGPRREIRWLPSCNLAVKRAAFERYGGFPTDMEASEDMLFARRLLTESGVALVFEPGIRIRHTNRNTFPELRGKMAKLGYWSGRSRGSGIIPGGLLLRVPWAIPMLVPYRLLTIVARVLLRSRDGRLIAVAVLLWPLLLYGLTHWARGFARGVGAGRANPGIPRD